MKILLFLCLFTIGTIANPFSDRLFFAFNIYDNFDNTSSPYVEKPIHCFNHGVYVNKTYFGLNEPNTCICDAGYHSNCSTYMNTLREEYVCVNADIDCDGNGKCVNNQCRCSDAYATVQGSTTQCTYKRKLQLTAFLLHIFLGLFGAGHWYIGNISYAMGQLSLSVIIPIGCTITVCIFMCIFTCNDSSKGLCSAGIAYGIIYAVCYFAGIIWWVVDVIRFADNDYLDGNGYGLNPWS